MRRRQAITNARRTVVTDYPGDPMGEAIAGPLAHRLGHQLAGGSGTIVPMPAGAGSNAFTGYTRGGLAVPTAANPILYRNNPAQLHNDVSDELDPYRAILAARLARRYR